MKKLILSIVVLSFLTSLYMIKASDCNGSVVLVLSPNTVEGEVEVKAIATGLTVECYGKLIQINRDSCSGPKVCSCESKGSGCSCSFKATLPSLGLRYYQNEYKYYVCVDKNEDDHFLDSGEQGFAMLTVRRKLPFMPLGAIESISQLFKSFAQAFAQLFKL